MPNTHGLKTAIHRNLEHLGFKVIDISYNEDEFAYQNVGQKAENFFRKTFLKDNEFKNQLKFNQLGKPILNILNNLTQKADFALLFRADIYPIEILEKIKSKTDKMVNYQWDGMHRFKGIFDRMHLFDRFFVFDPLDYQEFKDRNILLTTNFYFDNLPKAAETKYDFYFRGTYLRERMDVVNTFISKCEALNLKTKIEIYSEKTHRSLPANLYTNQAETYLNYYDKMLKSKYLVDFSNEAHDGLSFRIFEAMYTQKKLVINNKFNIKNYDLYQPENILIWDSENLDELEEFLKKPYQPLPEEIIQKYSFSNWIRYVLDIPPYQNLN